MRLRRVKFVSAKYVCSIHIMNCIRFYCNPGCGETHEQ